MWQELALYGRIVLPKLKHAMCQQVILCLQEGGTVETWLPLQQAVTALKLITRMHMHLANNMPVCSKLNGSMLSGANRTAVRLQASGSEGAESAANCINVMLA